MSGINIPFIRVEIGNSLPRRQPTYFEAIYSDHEGRRYRPIDQPSALEMLEYLPFFGTLVSIGRLFFGIMQINSSMLFLFFAPQFAVQLFTNGCKNIGRGFVGLSLPFFGGLILMAYDKHRRQQAHFVEVL